VEALVVARMEASRRKASKRMEVVLALGEVWWVESDTHKFSKELMGLVQGSYQSFPAIITKYWLRACKEPKCV
jgi:hypothetical protein